MKCESIGRGARDVTLKVLPAKYCMNTSHWLASNEHSSKGRHAYTTIASMMHAWGLTALELMGCPCSVTRHVYGYRQQPQDTGEEAMKKHG